MELKDTVQMMESPDFKERFKAEYYQLKIRMDGLESMLKKYREGTLPFTPKSSYTLLLKQLRAMELYLFFLEERAEIEGIEL